MLLLALLLGLAAALIWINDGRTGAAIVADGDVAAGARIRPDDLRSVTVPLVARPPGAISDRAQAVGMYARGPLPEGQYLLSGNLATDPAGALAESTVQIPSDWALVGVAMSYQNALGGALTPGQSVDLYAIGKRAGSTPLLIAPGVRVVDLRNGYGASAGRGGDGDRADLMESVLLALPRALVEAVVARVSDSVFVLALRL